MTIPNGAPECFGQLWDANAIECKGGYDPGYVSPNGGSKVRAKCELFDMCRSRVALKKANERPVLIPPQSIIRPPYGMPQPAVPYQQHGFVPGRPTQLSTPTVMAPQGQVSYQYPHAPMQIRPIEMMPVSHHMPSYLSESEHRQEGESYWAPLAREVTRGMLKAAGHSLAHFFDTVPFIRKPQ
jgi:hypothetical protein